MFVKCYLFAFAFALALIATIPIVKAEAPQTVPHIEHWSTKNGIPVYFVTKTQIPIIDIGVLFHAGSAQDGSIPGIAQFTMQMLDQGSKNLNADQIAEHFETVGAHFSTAINQDMAIINLRSLSAPQFFTPALNTFVSLFRDVNFPQDAIIRAKKQLLIALQQQAQTPNAIAAKTFYQILYGQHPYASPLLGTPPSIKQISQKKLLHFYHQYYVASNAMIAIVGNLKKDKAINIAEQIASTLPQGYAITALPTPNTQLTNRSIKVYYPSQQTTIFLGQIGINAKSSDYFPFLLGNQILGGGILTSQLFSEVRNKMGLCYGINSIFNALQVNGPFLIALQTRKNQAANALSITQKTLKNFLINGPSEKELIAAKQALIGSFPLSFSSNDAILATIEKIGFYQLPLNYLANYQQNIAQVSLQQIKTSFQRIKPEKMLIVMVGEK